MVIFIVLKNVKTNYNKIPQKLLFVLPRVGGIVQHLHFPSYIRSKLILPTRSS